MDKITWTETKGLHGTTAVARHGLYVVEIATTIRHRSEKTLICRQGSAVWHKVISTLPVWAIKQRAEAWMRGGPLKLPGRPG